MKILAALLSILLLTRCARSEGSLVIASAERYLPADIPPSALDSVINYVQSSWVSAHLSGSDPVQITDIKVAENRSDEIKLDVATNSSQVLFTLQSVAGQWVVVSAS